MGLRRFEVAIEVQWDMDLYNGRGRVWIEDFGEYRIDVLRDTWDPSLPITGFTATCQTWIAPMLAADTEEEILNACTRALLMEVEDEYRVEDMEH
jgi:hypothetical protein